MGGLALRLLVDTHVLIWWLDDVVDRLSPEQLRSLAAAEAAGEALGLAAVSLWEIAKLRERGRIALGRSTDSLIALIEAHRRVSVLPLSGSVALESTRLGERFPRDPADQLIAATARVHGRRLVTADRRIRESGAVSVI